MPNRDMHCALSLCKCYLSGLIQNQTENIMNAIEEKSNSELLLDEKEATLKDFLQYVLLCCQFDPSAFHNI